MEGGLFLVTERLQLNRDTDLVMFVDHKEDNLFDLKSTLKHN